MTAIVSNLVTYQSVKIYRICAIIVTVKLELLMHAADYRLTVCNFKAYVERSSTKTTKYLYDKGNYDKLRAVFGSVDWKEALAGGTVEEMWTLIKGKIDEAVKQHVPTCVNAKDGAGRQRRPQWMNTGVLASIRKKRRPLLDIYSPVTEMTTKTTSWRVT